MQTWEEMGKPERRKDDARHSENVHRLQIIEREIRNQGEIQSKWMEKHDLIILGDGDKPGLAGKVNAFTEDFKSHVINDRWIQGSILTIVLVLLGIALKGGIR